MKKRRLLSLALASLLTSNTLVAEENLNADLGGFEIEEVANEELSGFGEEESNDDVEGFGDSEDILSDESAQETPKESMFILSGNIAFKTSYGYREHSVKAYKTDRKAIDYSGINQAQISTYLQVDAKLNDNWKMRISGDAFYDVIYNVKDENYNQETLDAYQTQLRLDDVYVQGRLSHDIDLKVGRQIVVWGKSDSIRVTDVINPLDNRFPGMTDIEDLRLSTTMAKLDYYLSSWNFSAMAIGESRIFIEAAPRSEFFPVDSLFLKADGSSAAPDPFIDLENPDVSWDNTQFAFAANGIFSGWDLSFYAADVFDSKWNLKGIRRVSKIQMLGSAFNIVAGSWLLKSEVAYVNDVRYNSTSDEKSRFDTLVGLDYMGIKDTVFSVEVANKHIFDYEYQMSGVTLGAVPDFTEQDEVQTAIRATRSFENDSINATLLLSMFGHNWEYGGFFRASVEYDVIDALVATFGLVDYIDAAQNDKKPMMNAISDNDRVFADITYSF